jgi:Icc-related predicted phosphoesterase
MKKINVTLLSDTHTKERNVLVNGGDLILHSGDVMNSGYDWEDLYDFLTWFSELPYKMKVFTPGNHDRYIEDKPFDAWKMIREFNDKGVICLIDDFVEFEGLKIYGSPWQPEFYNWAYNLPRNGWEIEQKWKDIPDDTDILLTHGPAWGILDTVVNRRDFNLGCEMLAKRLETLHPLIHNCGHIHTGYGYVEKNGTHFFNSSILDERYRHNQKPFDITIDLETKQLDIL